LSRCVVEVASQGVGFGVREPAQRVEQVECIASGHLQRDTLPIQADDEPSCGLAQVDQLRSARVAPVGDHQLFVVSFKTSSGGKNDRRYAHSCSKLSSALMSQV